MLQFDSDDYLEINDADLSVLRRSRASVSLTMESGRSFDIRAILCQQKRDGEPATHLLFYSPVLKRAIVFQLSGGDARGQLKLGEEYLADFGFQLEEVSLDLKPAVRDVVLRDIPSLQKKEAIRRLREERNSRIAGFEKTLKALGKPAPSSKEGVERKRILEQLQAERQVEESLDTLLKHLEGQLLASNRQLDEPQDKPLEAPKAAPKVDPERVRQILEQTAKSRADVPPVSQERPKEVEKTPTEKAAAEKAAAEKAAAEKAAAEKAAAEKAAAEKAAAEKAAAEKAAPAQVKKPQLKESPRQGQATVTPPVEELRKELNLARARQTQLEDELHKARADQDVDDKRRSEQQKLKRRLEELEAELTGAAERLEQERRDKQELEGELKQFKARHKSALQKLSDTEEKLSAAEQIGKNSGAAESLLAKTQNKLDQRSDALKTQLEVAARLEKDLDATRRELADAETARRQTETALKQQEQEFRKELGGVSKELAGVSKQLDSARQKSEQEGRELAKLFKESAGLQKELAGAQKDLAGAQQELAEAQSQLGRRDKELAESRRDVERLQGQFQALEQKHRKLESSQGSLERQYQESVDQLAAAEKKLAGVETLERKCKHLTEDLEQVRQQFDLERQAKDSLAKDASRIAARLKNLEADFERTRAELAEAEKSRDDATRLQAELNKLRDRLDNQTRENAALVEDYAALRRQLAAGGNAGAATDAPAGAEPLAASAQTERLNAQLLAAESQVRDLVLQKEQLAIALVEEQNKNRALQEAGSRSTAAAAAAVPVREAKPDLPQKPPPHVVRKPPLPGATFHVDWDLEALPCEPAAVKQAWESIYNVTLSIEGYPHQYVGALIVLLGEKSKERLLVAFRLDKEKRNLIYRPVRKIGSDADLKKALNEAQSFLRVSGIEVETVAAEQIKKVLEPYLA